LSFSGKGGKTQQEKCKATWDKKNLLNRLDDVAAYGMGVSKVAEIHRGLTSLGFLNKDVGLQTVSGLFQGRQYNGNLSAALLCLV
jgi:hypothetical protein